MHCSIKSRGASKLSMPKAPQRSPGPAHSPALAQPCSAAQHHVGLSTDPLGGSGPYRDAAISSHPCDRRANPEQMISSGSAPCSRLPPAPEVCSHSWKILIFLLVQAKPTHLQGCADSFQRWKCRRAPW